MSVERLPIQQRAAISEEEFLSWHDDPVTRWVLSACRKAAEENRLAWTDITWKDGNPDSPSWRDPPDHLTLVKLKSRADAYLALADTQYAGWLKTHGEDE